MVSDLHALGELAGTDAEKGNTVTVRRIHIGLNFENEAGKILLFRMDLAADRLARPWWRSHLDKTIKHFSNTEIINGAAEKHRSLACF